LTLIVRQSENASVGRLRVCRRFLLLIYATAVVYFFYAPWNYVFLGVLLFVGV
jgi:hypothetical protein